ncbi:uncharacterized protein METZ01_LOCUS173695 [marine metagenome]|uniref:Uncharacterized protein n=1 Tax=marine metagenome TaxID=408172 RepID=A0A382C555_9ZZZZ
MAISYSTELSVGSRLFGSPAFLQARLISAKLLEEGAPQDW